MNTKDEIFKESLTAESPRELSETVRAHARAGEDAQASEKVPSKRLKIRIEDSDNGKVIELEAQSAIIYAATDYEPKDGEEGGTRVAVYQNFLGGKSASAIAYQLETESDRIMEEIFSWKPNAKEEGDGDDK